MPDWVQAVIGKGVMQPLLISFAHLVLLLSIFFLYVFNVPKVCMERILAVGGGRRPRSLRLEI